MGPESVRKRTIGGLLAVHMVLSQTKCFFVPEWGAAARGSSQGYLIGRNGVKLLFQSGRQDRCGSVTMPRTRGREGKAPVGAPAARVPCLARRRGRERSGR